MLSSSGSKTSLLKASNQGVIIKAYEASLFLKTEPYSLKPISNMLCLKVSQPGLPSWWSLAAPQLNWVSSFTSHLAWATLVMNPSPLLLGQDNSLKVDWMVPSSRLVTLTRGPMASKKKSSVQFSLVSKPLQLRLHASVNEGLGLTPQGLMAGLGVISAEESFWASSLPTPMTLAKSKLVANVTGAVFLLWR